MAKKRDYKAEYQRRIEKGQAKGLSRSEARGHGKPRSSGIVQKAGTFKFDRQLEEGLKAMRSGKSLNQSAKSIHVSADRLRRYIEEAGVAEKKSGRWRFVKDTRKWVLPIFSKGKRLEITVNYSEAQKVGAYTSAVGTFLTTNNLSTLESIDGSFVVDMNGKKYLLETRPNVLYKLNATQDETFEETYRIVA